MPDELEQFLIEFEGEEEFNKTMSDLGVEPDYNESSVDDIFANIQSQPVAEPTQEQPAPMQEGAIYDDTQGQILQETFGTERASGMMTGKEQIPEYAIASDQDRKAREHIREMEARDDYRQEAEQIAAQETPEYKRASDDLEFKRDEASLLIPRKTSDQVDPEILSQIIKESAKDPVRGSDLAKVYNVRYKRPVRKVLADASRGIREDFDSAISDEFKVLNKDFSDKDTIGVKEKLAGKDWQKAIPIYGGMKSARDLAEIYASAQNIKKMQSGEIERIPEQARADAKIVANFLAPIMEAEQRGAKWYAQAAEGVIDMVPYAAEIALSGGMGKSLSIPARAALRKIVGRTAGKLTGAIIGSATTALTTSAGRTAESAINNIMPDIAVNEDGSFIITNKETTPAKAIFKAIASNTIEILSERSGAFLGKIAGKVMPKSKAMPTLWGKIKSRMTLVPPKGKSVKWVVSKLDDIARTANKAKAAAKFDSFKEEIGEEFLGSTLKAVTGAEDFNLQGDNNTVFNRFVASVPSLEQSLVMMATIAVPSGGIAMLNASSTYVSKGADALKTRSMRYKVAKEILNDRGIDSPSRTEVKGVIGLIKKAEIELAAAEAAAKAKPANIDELVEQITTAGPENAPEQIAALENIVGEKTAEGEAAGLVKSDKPKTVTEADKELEANVNRERTIKPPGGVEIDDDVDVEDTVEGEYTPKVAQAVKNGILKQKWVTEKLQEEIDNGEITPIQVAALEYGKEVKYWKENADIKEHGQERLQEAKDKKREYDLAEAIEFNESTQGVTSTVDAQEIADPSVDKSIAGNDAYDDLAANRKRAQEIEKRIDDEGLELKDLPIQDALFLASVNPVTGMKNKLSFRYSGSKGKFVASIDADGLKTINDSFGHDAGNVLLSGVAEELAAQGVDVYHVGGDEFVMIGNDKDVLHKAARLAREKLEKRNLTYTNPDGKVIEFSTSFSYGVAEDMRTADKRMMDEKRQRTIEKKRSARDDGAEAMVENAEARGDVLDRPSDTMGRTSEAKPEVKKKVELSAKSKKIADYVADIVEQFGQTIGDDIIIVDNKAAAKEYMTETHKKARTGKKSKLRGFYSPKTGKIILIADSLNTAKQAKKTLIHELVGHKGVHAINGVSAELKKLAKKMPKYMINTLGEIAKRRNFNLSTEQGRYKAINEYIAELAPRHKDNTVIAGLVNIIKNALSKIGIANATNAYARKLLNISKTQLAEKAKADGHTRDVQGEVEPTFDIDAAIQRVDRGVLPDDIQDVIDQVGGIVRNDDNVKSMRERMAELAKISMREADVKVKTFLAAAGKKMGLKVSKNLTSKTLAKKLRDQIKKIQSKPVTNVKAKIHKAVGITKDEPVIEKTQSQLNRLVLRAQRKAAALAHKMGVKESKADQKLAQEYIDAWRNEVTKYAKKLLPPAIIGKAINIINRTHNTASGTKALAKIDVIAAQEEHKQAITNVKAKIHKAVGITKDEPVIEKTQSQLNRLVLRAQRKAAALAHKMGVKEGKADQKLAQEYIDTWRNEVTKYAKKLLPPAIRGKAINIINRTHNTASGTKALAKIDVIAVQEEHKQAIKSLNKSIGKAKRFTAAGEDFHKMDKRIKKAMQDMVGGIDVKRRTSKLKEAINWINDQQSEIDMPEDIKNYIDKAAELYDKTNIHEMTVDEIKQAKDAIDYMLHWQKEFNSERIGTFNNKVKTVIDKSMEIMGPIVKTPNKTIKIGRASIPRRIWNRVGEKIESFSVLFDDGDNGPMLKVFEGWLKGFDKWRRKTDGYWDTFKNKVEITNDDVNWTDYMGKPGVRKSIKLEGGATVDLTPAQMMYVYLANKSDESRGMMLTAGFAYGSPVKGFDKIKRMVNKGFDTDIVDTPMTEADIDNIISELTDKQKEYSDAMSSVINNEMAADINEATSQRYGYDFATKENYIPQFRLADAVQKKKESISTSIESAIRNQSVLEEQPFLKERTGGKATFIIPDMFQVFTEHAQRAGSVNGLMVHTRFIKGIVDNPQWMQRVKNKWGDDTYNVYRKMIDRTTGDIRKNQDDKIFQKLRNNYAGGSLVMTPSVWLSQPLSLPLASTEIDSEYLLSESLKNFLPGIATAKQKKILADIRAKSYMLETRAKLGSYQKELAALAGSGETLSRIHDKTGIRQKAGWAMGKFDNYAIEKIMLAAHAQATAEGKNLDEVVALAERAVRRSQPTFNMINRTWLGGHELEIVQWLTMFRSYRDAALSNMSINLRKKGPGSTNKKILSVGNAMITGTITNAARLYLLHAVTSGEWDDFGDFIGNAIDSVLGMFPFAGDISKIFRDRYNKKSFRGQQVMPPPTAIVDLWGSIAEFSKATTEWSSKDYDEREKAIKSAKKGVKSLSRGAKALGIPDAYRRVEDIIGIYGSLTKGIKKKEK